MNDLAAMLDVQRELRAAYNRAERLVLFADSYTNAMIDSLSEIMALVQHGRHSEACDLARMLADTTGRLLAERTRDSLALGLRIGQTLAKADIREEKVAAWVAERFETGQPPAWH